MNHKFTVVKTECTIGSFFSERQDPGGMPVGKFSESRARLPGLSGAVGGLGGGRLRGAVDGFLPCWRKVSNAVDEVLLLL
jgi:hypothetical protein